ncbi:DUF6691 family protein [Halobacteriovorax sp.]|uniref:DUF6691 family protein n=1 Tax=Halobacteriovorax sp. TaxID=2020862 RepID=UPI003561BD1B
MALNLISLISGTLFSIGLILSGMTNPKKVIGFLDIFGEWDYSLAFVMVGAILVNFLVFKFLKKEKPVCGNGFSLPTKSSLDWKLITGSALFGIGWGIVGICPGPGIVNLTSLSSEFIIFVGSMMAGMFIFKLSGIK